MWDPGRGKKKAHRARAAARVPSTPATRASSQHAAPLAAGGVGRAPSVRGGRPAAPGPRRQHRTPKLRGAPFAPPNRPHPRAPSRWPGWPRARSGPRPGNNVTKPSHPPVFSLTICQRDRRRRQVERVQHALVPDSRLGDERDEGAEWDVRHGWGGRGGGGGGRQKNEKASV